MATSISVRQEGLLTVRVDQEGDSLLVRASGEIDIASAKMLEEELRRALSCDASPIALDLAEVSFIDSTGLRVLLWAAERSRENGNHLRMRNGSAAVRRAIQVTGVERSLPVT